MKALTDARYGGLPARLLTPEPASVDRDRAGSLPLAGLTAHQVLGRPEAHGGTWMWVRPSAEGFTQPSRLVDRGVLRIELARSVPLAEGAEACRLSQQGHVRGKAAVRMD